MTRLIYSKDANLQSQEASPTTEPSEILHLKKLLVTLKQHYENSLHTSQIQLQAEQNQRIALQKELDNAKGQLLCSQKAHAEELQALRNQQSILKDLLKKAQQELNESKEQAEREIQALQHHLETHKASASIETVVSKTSSHHLRQELEEIKKTLAHETKSLETRYVELLNEKAGLDHQCKQYQQQLEQQSSNLVAYQNQLNELEMHRTELREALRLKESDLSELSQRIQEMQKQIQNLNADVSEKDFIQDKYEQLKDEWNQLGERLEEAEEARTQAEQTAKHLQESNAKHEAQLAELAQQMQSLQEEKQNLEAERDQLKLLLDEGETRLKVAQQHLAKKVKEAALLNERVEEQQNNLAEMSHSIEQQKTQVVQLQANVDLYQRQEKRLQEQLHDALKGTESQVAKWEEKYFRMYDKWQETENKIRELRKYEEKHLQMQHLLANLGNFMGSSLSSQPGNYPSGAEAHDRNVRSLPIDEPTAENHSLHTPKAESDERYDVFGMRQPPEKYKPHT